MTKLDEATIQLYEAIKKKDPLKVRQAIENGADVNTKNNYGQTWLYYAMAFGNVGVARLLIENGAEVRGHGVLGEFAAYGRGGAEMAKLLLDAGADIEEATSGGYTPLLIAAGRGYTDVVRVFLEAGAYINAMGTSGKTAKSLAYERGYLDSAKLIEKYER